MAELTYRSGDTLLGTIFGVFTRSQTYINIIYLYLSFPLGIGYFIFLVVGLALGFGLMITWLGIPILLLTIAGAWLLSALERELAIRMLGEDIPPIFRNDLSGLGMWGRLKALLTNPVTWTGLLYLFAKFPIGIASFVISTVLLAVSWALVTAPVHYRWGSINFGSWKVDTLSEAFILLPIGLMLVVVTPHLLNFAAFLCGRFAYMMLGARWWETSTQSSQESDNDGNL